MSIETGSSAMMMALWVNKLIFSHKMYLSSENKRVVLLDSSMSAYFSIGRDVNSEPYIGIPEELLPWFADLSWSEFAIDRKNGYVYLVCRALDTKEMLFAVGIRIRTKRIAAFQTAQEERAVGRVVNMKKVVVESNKEETKVMLSDDHIYTGLTIISVDGPAALSVGVYDDEYANTLMTNAGLDESHEVFRTVN